MSSVELATKLGAILQQQNKMLTTAESCTGGWAAQAVTAVAGSSHWFERGFVTYSNLAKQEMLGVSAKILSQQGAVSEATAQAMALGALQHSQAHVSIATTGIAGPDGGSDTKPVGMVWFAWGLSEANIVTKKCVFDGDREAVRRQAVEYALSELVTLISL